MKELIENVLQWGIEKGITGPTGKGTILGQADKMIEEANETDFPTRVGMARTVSEPLTSGGMMTQKRNHKSKKYYTENEYSTNNQRQASSTID